MIPEFRAAVLAVKGGDIEYRGPLCPEGGMDVEASRPGDEPLFMPCELQRLFAYMHAANVRALSTKALTRSFGWDGSEEQVQHDIHELARFFLEGIENHMPGDGGKMVPDLFKGSWVSEVVCKGCGNVSRREEPFYDINLTVEGYGGVVESWESMTEPEAMEGDNQYLCVKCNGLRDALKRLKICKLPPVLCLSLLRSTPRLSAPSPKP